MVRALKYCILEVSWVKKKISFLGIRLFWYNMINYPKLWQILTLINHKSTCHNYVDGTENLLNILKETLLPRETSKKILSIYIL